MIHIRVAGPQDHNSIWQIIQEVISKGETYVFDPDSSKEEMLDYWCGSPFCIWKGNWQKLGFKIIGEIPEAFNHPTEGYVDACIMWRKL